MKLDLGCGIRPREGHVGVERPRRRRHRHSTVEVLVRGEHRLSVLPSVAQEMLEATISSGVAPHEIRVEFDLASGESWPFRDGSVEGLSSHHVIEHLPAGDVDAEDGREMDALLFFFDEAWRVSRPGSTFELVWPAPVFEDTGMPCWAAFRDPTHRRFIPKELLIYLARGGRDAMMLDYPVSCDWVVQPGAARQRRSADLAEYEVSLSRGC